MAGHGFGGGGLMGASGGPGNSHDADRLANRPPTRGGGRDGRRPGRHVPQRSVRWLVYRLLWEESCRGGGTRQLFTASGMPYTATIARGGVIGVGASNSRFNTYRGLPGRRERCGEAGGKVAAGKPVREGCRPPPICYSATSPDTAKPRLPSPVEEEVPAIRARKTSPSFSMWSETLSK